MSQGQIDCLERLACSYLGTGSWLPRALKEKRQMICRIGGSGLGSDESGDLKSRRKVGGRGDPTRLLRMHDRGKSITEKAADDSVNE